MIVYPRFVTDDDDRLTTMQHDCYGDVIRDIVNIARERYFDAEKVFRSYGSMSIQVRQLYFFDHRVVQDMHDIIAAWFRFTRRTERMFPLPDDIIDQWRWFATRELNEVSKDPEFVTGVLDACVHANSERGYAGEKRALKILKYRYSEMLSYTLPRAQPDPQ